MYVLMVTGGLGSGKSTACDYFRDRGAMVVDLDAIAKEEQETPLLLSQIAQAFGDDVLDFEGALIPSVLADRAFSSKEELDKLNALCWPPVIERVADLILGSACRARSYSDLLVIEAPLLAEVPELAELADETLCITAPEEIRLARVIERGMRPEDARNRLELQASEAERLAICNSQIDNSGSYAAFLSGLDSWWATYRAGGLPL